MRVGARDLRLVPAALAAWLVAGVGVGLTDAVPYLGVMLWVLAATALLATRRWAWSGIVALALIGGAVAASAVLAGVAAREPPELVRAARISHAIELAVGVTGHPIDGRVAGTALGAPVLLFGDVGGAGIGDVLHVTGSLKTADPGEDISFLVFTHGPVHVERRPEGVVGAADELRARFVRIVRDLPGRGAGLLPGLSIGDTTAVDPQLDADMKTASLSHLTAVSGSNCALVIGLVFALCSVLGLPRWARVGVSLVALAGFVVLVTPQPSVLRAAVMAGIALGALALSRPAHGVPLLSAAVIVLIATDPWLSRSYGFALSVLATGGLLVLAAPLARVLGRVLPRAASLVIAVPLAAQSACQPVLLMLDPSLPLYGVVANVLAEPAAPLATVAGLAACLIAPLLPGAALVLTWIAWVPASWIAAVAGFTAGLPGARSPWPTGPVGVVLLVVVTAAALVLVLGAGPPRARRIVGAAMVVALIAYAGTLAGTRFVTDLGRPGDWEFAMCDVGQGDASVIRSEGRIAVIDTGPKPDRMARCLDELGIDRIQLLVLTHYDLDHVGGTDAVVGRVDRALIGPPSDPGDARIAAELRAGGAEVDQVSRGEAGTLGKIDWQVLWPPPRGAEPGNPASVTILATPGKGCSCLSGVFLGDLGQESQFRLLGTAHPPHVDVVKVAHHGSGDQEPRLYESIRATVGLIGVGADNTYGHPTQKLLGILSAVGTRAVRTDLDGLILVAPGDHGAVRVWTERGG